MKRNRAANRDVIDISDDDSPKDRPPQKVEKKEPEALPSQEVLELRQKVAKLEKDFQGACRVARKAELRVDFLENLLDKKTTPIGKTDEKLVKDLQEQIDEMSSKLASSERESSQWNEKWRQANAARMTDLARIEELMGKLTRCEGDLSRLNEELKQANEDGMCGRTRIGELMRQLSTCEQHLRQADEADEDRRNDLAELNANSNKAARKEEHSTKLINEKAQEITALKLGLMKLSGTVTRMEHESERMTRDFNCTLSSVRQQAHEEQQRDRDRIEELTGRLWHYEPEVMYSYF